MSVKENDSASLSSPAFRPGRLLIIVGVILAAVVCIALVVRRRGPEELHEFPACISKAESQKSADEFSQLFHRQPTHADVLMLLAETSLQQNHLEKSVDCFAAIPTDHRRYGPAARFQEGQILLRLNKADRAEDRFQLFLQLAEKPNVQPEQIKLARKWLVYLLAVQLRLDERKVILEQMVADQEFDVYDAKQLYFPSLLIWQSNLGRDRLRKFLNEDPTNRRLQTAWARYLVGEGNLAEAHQLLATLRQQVPRNAEVVAASLECSFEENNWRHFAEVIDEAPQFVESEPTHLTRMRGEWALHNSDWAMAEQWLLHVLRRDPANPICHMGLARAYQGLGRAEDRHAIQRQSLILARIRVKLSAVDNNSPQAVRLIAADAEKLGMKNAAETWSSLANRMEASTSAGGQQQ